jgi:hypothetical protein
MFGVKDREDRMCRVTVIRSSSSSSFATVDNMSAGVWYVAMNACSHNWNPIPPCKVVQLFVFTDQMVRAKSREVAHLERVLRPIVASLLPAVEKNGDADKDHHALQKEKFCVLRSSVSW